MRFEQVKNVLQDVRAFHGRASEFFAGLSDLAEQERVKMLLDYMSLHERELGEKLGAYEQQASEGLLETWMDFRQDGELTALCREAAVAALGALHAGRQTILAALEDKATVRRRAVIALAPFDGPDIDAALQAALADRDWQVRQAAEDQLSDG